MTACATPGCSGDVRYPTTGLCGPCYNVKRRRANPCQVDGRAGTPRNPLGPVVIDMLTLERDVPCSTDPEAWFPASGASVAAVKAICAGCWFRVGCLEWGLRIGAEEGIWGGVGIYRYRNRKVSK